MERRDRQRRKKEMERRKKGAMVKDQIWKFRQNGE